MDFHQKIEKLKEMRETNPPVASTLGAKGAKTLPKPKKVRVNKK